MTYRASLLCFAVALSLTAADPVARGRAAEPSAPHKQGGHEQSATATPIQHLVVIFQENVSFDHYFGTYPKAENRPGETRFSATEDMPRLINGLRTPLDVTQGFRPLRGVSLLRNNPSASPNAPAGGTVTNGADASNPIRLSPAQALTADQGHNYLPEQQAFDNGLMDAFPAFTGVDGPPPSGSPPIKGLVMGYTNRPKD